MVNGQELPNTPPPSPGLISIGRGRGGGEHKSRAHWSPGGHKMWGDLIARWRCPLEHHEWNKFIDISTYSADGYFRKYSRKENLWQFVAKVLRKKEKLERRTHGRILQAALQHDRPDAFQKRFSCSIEMAPWTIRRGPAARTACGIGELGGGWEGASGAMAVKVILPFFVLFLIKDSTVLPRPSHWGFHHGVRKYETAFARPSRSLSS